MSKLSTSSTSSHVSGLIAYTTSGEAHQSSCATSNKEYDFLDFLGVAQSLKLDLLPFTWQPGLDTFAEGGTAEIRQALVNVRLTFAFKHLKRPRSSTEEVRNLRALIAEISVLGHPVIQRHPNIATIAGVSWDVVAGGEKVWPVLVFEKTQHGDLSRFMTFGPGKELDIKDRFDLLFDVGFAIRTLHGTAIIHGDIKPSNVLIYSEDDGRYRAKVTDFGYSSLFATDNDTITMPCSQPWTAPEQHHREIPPAQARKMDAYSFGMLCLWLLFYNRSPDQDRNFREDFEESQKEPLSPACELLGTEIELQDQRKDDLRKLFTSTLARDLAERTADFTGLLQLLSSNRTRNLIYLKEEISIPKGDFQLVRSSHQLIKAHYGVRRYLVECLRTRDSQRLLSQSQALDLALCYELGFGVGRNKVKCKIVLRKNEIPVGKLKDLIKQLRGNPDPSTFRGGDLRRLSKDGYFPVFDFGRQYREEQRLHEAETLYQSEIKTLGSSLRDSHPLVQQLRLQLCMLMRSENRQTDAEKLQLQMIKLDQRVSLESPLTDRFVTSLAQIFGQQGQLEEIEKLQTFLVNMDQKRLGAAHPLTLNSMANLASTYSQQKKWKKAEELQVQIVEREKKMPLTRELPQTINNLAALASTYQNQQRWKEAEELKKQVLEMRGKALGLEHPQALLDLANLARTYIEQKRWREAEELGRQGLETSRKLYGAENPNTVNLTANLAMVYNEQGRWEEAEQLRTQVMETRKKTLGMEHEDTLESMANLATTYSYQLRRAEAEQLRTQVMETRKRTLGTEHPDTLLSMANLAMVYHNQDRWDEAEKLRVYVYETRKKTLGMENSKTLLSMAFLATTYSRQKRWQEAEHLRMHVMKTRMKILGVDHPDTVKSIVDLASTYEDQESWDKAEKLTLQLVDIRKRLKGAEDLDTLDSMGNLVSIYQKQGRWKEAEELDRQSMQTRNRFIWIDDSC